MTSLPVVTTSATNPYQPLGQRQDGARSDFRQLAQALKSGDLSAAQQAFTALQKAIPQGATAAPNQGTGGPAQSAFAALGQALQAGNLASAQQAFSQLQQAGGQHHHHHHGGGGGATAASATSATGGDTLNITNNSGTINEIVGSGASSAGETINITGNTGTINLIA